jgi:hypothetical protein
MAIKKVAVFTVVSLNNRISTCVIRGPIGHYHGVNVAKAVKFFA